MSFTALNYNFSINKHEVAAFIPMTPKGHQGFIEGQGYANNKDVKSPVWEGNFSLHIWAMLQ